MSLIVKIVTAVGLAAAAIWSASSVPVPAPAPALAPWGPSEASAEVLADSLALDVLIGQVVGAPDDATGLDRAIAEGRVGRIVVSPRRVDAHLARLRDWQARAPLPLSLATQAEQVALDGPLTASTAGLAAAARPDLAFMTGRARAESARDLGIQTPGSGLRLGADETSERPVEQALVRGLREGQTLPAVTLAPAADLDAFDTLAEAGLMEVHVDASTPSGAALVGQVAQRGSYRGLVVADLGRSAAGAVAALRDGADLVVSSTPSAAYDSLSHALRTGRLAAERVREASRRILAAKAWSGLELVTPEPRGGGDGSTRGLRIDPLRAPSASLLHRTQLLTAEIARASVAVVQTEEGPLPLVGPRPRRVFTVVLDPGASVERALPFVNTLATGLGPGSSASYARLGLGQDEAHYREALDATRDADVVVIAAFPDADGRLAARHQAVLGSLPTRLPTVMVAFDDGALAAGMRRPGALLVANGTSEMAQTAAAQAIAGQIPVSGRLTRPVAGLAATGDGVRLAQQVLRPGSPEEAGIAAGAAARIDDVMQRAVSSGAFPGGAIAVGRSGVLLALQGYGRLTAGGARVTPDTPYDLASLTKVVGTTATAMRMVEDGRLDLDAEVVETLPRFRTMGKEYVTTRQLLSHSAGQRPWYPFHAHDIASREEALDFIYADTLRYPPGTRSRYSDFDMIVLGEMITTITREPLGDLFDDEIFEPLGMTATGFRGVGVRDPEAAPTETDATWRGRTLQGEVHDEAASVFGGEAGHAGLFSTASDMARFGFMLANGGQANGTRLFRRTTLERFTERVRLRSTYPTGLGWMVNYGDTSAGSAFGPRSFGHTGFTGTSIWVDPDQELFVVLLTNRVHPSRRNTRIREVRPALADAVAGAIQTPPREPARAWGFGPVPTDLPGVAVR